jgi:hypothetical protein
LHSTCIVDHSVSSPQPIEKNEVYISILSEHVQHCNFEDDQIDSKPYQILSPSTITIDPCHQFVKPHIQPIVVKTRIRDKMFKPLRLPSHLHPYPLNFFEYLPCFFGEGHITAERHLGAFENFVDQLEIVHEDVTMRLFSKSLFGDVVWFKGLGADFIGSWIELCNAFLRYWGENKSLDQYLAHFNALMRGEEQALAFFNSRSDLPRLLPWCTM